jgi:hypothetical protein
MGPWFIRDEAQPHRPGCSYETILVLIARGKVTLDSVLRGPTTAQFWYPAKRIPGIASKLGVCHACQTRIEGESGCPSCHTLFEVEGDRQTLGLMPIRMIPAPGASEGNGTLSAAPAAAESRSNPPVARVMGSIAVPSVAENRLRAELAAARQRSTLLLVALALVALVSLVVFAAFATASSRNSPDRAAQPPSQPSQSQPPQARGAASLDTAPNPIPVARPEVSNAPGVVNSQPEMPPAAAPPPSSVPAAPINPTNAELDVLRRTKLP